MAQGGTTTARPMTAEEFYDWANHPDRGGRSYELVRGEVVEVSRPGDVHGFVCANVARILGNFTFARRKGYVGSNDPGVVLERDPDTVRGPDLVLFDQGR